MSVTQMFVNQILNEAKKRLVIIETTALLTEAARKLSVPRIELLVVCNPDGRVAGVITKEDIVRRISYCEGATCRTTVASAMTRDLVSCHPDDALSEVWNKMKKHGLRHIPVIDAQSNAIGLLNARDTLKAMLDNATHQTDLLLEYVMSVGYH